ncbi:MAG TPA: hypothetical protein DIT65_06175 [Cryomorphaceae bacterium]|nr:hypothetical protein [Cryomorphaceae bacterium]|tara:strand:+ start:2754 stop:3278 length:525 start_codon:yes stop_codon:yes gene_type:complete
MEFFLRVIADTDDTVIREVRIKGGASMMKLHEHIFSEFKLNPGEMASFYYSTPNWDQGDELPMFAMDDEMQSMEGTSVDQFFNFTKNGFYVYNFLDMNIFYLEVVKTEEEEGFEDFVVLSSVGELPERMHQASSKDPSQMSDAELNALYGMDGLDSGALPRAKESDEDSYGYDY